MKMHVSETNILRELNLELTTEDVRKIIQAYALESNLRDYPHVRNVANDILRERVKGAEKVYQRSIASGCFCKWRTGDDTRSAYLLGISLLRKEEGTE